MAKPNIKALFVNHFEKGLFAVACLIALAALFGSSWLPYSHHPNEIIQKVQEAEAKVKVKTWPKEEQENLFTVPDGESVEELVQANIRHQVDPTPYEFEVSFSPGLYDVTKPITEPELVGVNLLIAEAGRFLMGVQPKDSRFDESLEDPLIVDDANKKPEEDDESDIPEEFRTRNAGGAGGTGTAGLGAPGMAPPAMGGAGMEGGAGMLGMIGMGMGGGRKMEDEMADMAAMMAGGPDAALGGAPGMAGASTMHSNVEGRGLRYVSVRGIIPLRDQIRKYMKSIHVRFPQAASLYEIIEFELERKKMQPGDNPWGGEWQLVDIDIAKDILKESLTFDPDVVQSSITDSAVTMPLPNRLMGVWKSRATHPQLEDFTLSPDEMEKELAFNTLMVKQYQEQQESAPEQLVQKKGFSDLTYDSRSMQTGAFNMQHQGVAPDEMDDDRGGRGRGARGGKGMGMAMPAMGGMDATVGMGGMMGGMGAMNYAPTTQGATTKEAQEFLDKLEKFKDLNKDERAKAQDEAILDYIKKRVSAQGELLLFRYFDFDVEPGATYKYRARLVVRNPNFGLPLAQVAGLAHVVEGQTRKSDWSNDTEPATVPLDVDYFVAKIEDKGAGLAEARMAVFQWNPDFGTTIYDSLKIGLGEEIGELKKETFVLDPAKNRFEVEPYDFHTGDVLVDALPEDTISPSDHPDLELPRNARKSLGISGQVLISQGSGELAVIDHLSRIPALQARRQYLEYEQREYEDIKNLESKQVDKNDLESQFGEYGGAAGAAGMADMMKGMTGGMMGGMMQGTSDDFGKGKRHGNALRKPQGKTRKADR